MDSLPPIGWERLATKEDLADLKEDMAALEERLDARIDKRIAKQTYVILVGVATTVAAMLTPVYLALFTAPAGG